MPIRPCWAEISTSALESNFRLLCAVAVPDAELLAIVKADAYGHSLAICAPAAVRAGARWLGVTSAEEGAVTRAICPDARILVMGGVFPGQGPAIIANGLAAVVWQVDQIAELHTAARASGAGPNSADVHLEIDTGMSRQGSPVDRLGDLLPLFSPDSPLRLSAVMTHLYASDEADGVSTTEQLACLDWVMSQVAECHLQPDFLSVGASAALLGPEASLIAGCAARWKARPMLRPGLALYGLTPHYDPGFETGAEPIALLQAQAGLKPVMAWKTRIADVRTIDPGTEIGYNGTFVATETMRVALIPAGYADGLDRGLGNRFSLLVRGEFAPLVGRINMDQAVLDVTEIEGAETGDEVVIMGAQGAESITAFDHAAASRTIPWEVFTRIGPRVARVAV